ncbi:MAG: thioredoxin family protein [Holophagales bacterium]|jgi:thiol-disulfide isomerase/thioredoxin|nr:thioredoxin family protein [Holophagales bacterium]
MRTVLLSSVVFVSAALCAQVAEKPAPAPELVTKAVNKSAADNKKTMVAFHASWCGWCKRLETYLEMPDIKPIIEKYYSVLWLTILERDEKKELENPGADTFFAKWTNGANTGIPFYVVLDSKEEVLASSIQPLKPGDKPGNIGFPGNDEERKAFISFLKIGAPAITAPEEAALLNGLESIMAK